MKTIIKAIESFFLKLVEWTIIICGSIVIILGMVLIFIVSIPSLVLAFFIMFWAFISGNYTVTYNREDKN